MARFARVEGGVVREILVADKLPPFHPEIAAQFIAVADDVLEGWHRSGDALVPPPPPPAPTYRELRAAAYRDEMGRETEDSIKTIGDVLDTLLGWAAGEIAAGRAQATPEIETMLTKRAEIKDRIPIDINWSAPPARVIKELKTEIEKLKNDN